ncbi:MAG: hypothetical protein ACLFVR_16055 [Thiohalospira sp.]
MREISKQYIIDENNKKVAVQISIADFEKIEKTLEDYALGKLIEDTDDQENLSVHEAEVYYQNLLKKNEGKDK